MWLLNILILVFGLGALIKGADILVKKSVVLAQRFSVSPFFVGVVLLGLGTSAPEMAVSAFSSFKGLSQLAVSNVFGSNIFNILLVLGMILFQPLSLEKVRRIRTDIWFLVLTGFSLGFLMRDLFLSRLEAFFLSLLFLSYMILCYWTRHNREKALTEPEEQAKPVSPDDRHKTDKLPKDNSLEGPKIWAHPHPLAGLVGWVLFGFFLLTGGSKLTVMGAEGLGQNVGISERIMGLLIVSAGTSLPELVASLVAIVKGQRDMAIGNIIGSNVFNTFAVLGLAVWIRPTSLELKILTLDLPALWITHLLLLFLIFGYQKKWVQKSLPYIFLISYMLFLLAIFKFNGLGVG